MGTYPQSLEEWGLWLESYRSIDADVDDHWAYQCCRLAYQAAQQGNFGVGSLLLGPNGHVLMQGGNEVFTPYFRSDRHAEMVVIDAFEDQYKSLISMRDFTLYTSLESCPMCMARLITSGCGRVLYVAPDPMGGMVHRCDKLPPIWQQLAAPPRQVWGEAHCSPDLKTAASEIFSLTVKELNIKLQAR